MAGQLGPLGAAVLDKFIDQARLNVGKLRLELGKIIWALGTARCLWGLLLSFPLADECHHVTAAHPALEHVLDGVG